MASWGVKKKSCYSRTHELKCKIIIRRVRRAQSHLDSSNCGQRVAIYTRNLNRTRIETQNWLAIDDWTVHSIKEFSINNACRVPSSFSSYSSGFYFWSTANIACNVKKSVYRFIELIKSVKALRLNSVSGACVRGYVYAHQHSRQLSIFT
jgi:hypothetical protein